MIPYPKYTYFGFFLNILNIFQRRVNLEILCQKSYLNLSNFIMKMYNIGFVYVEYCSDVVPIMLYSIK